MDVITVGSPVQIVEAKVKDPAVAAADREDSSTASSGVTTVTSPPTTTTRMQLPPLQPEERLLPIGAPPPVRNQTAAAATADGRIMDRVWQVLGDSTEKANAETIPLIEQKKESVFLERKEQKRPSLPKLAFSRTLKTDTSFHSLDSTF